MAHFDKKELLAIAHLSALKLEEKELEPFTQQIQAILSYVDQLNQVHVRPLDEHTGNINIFRDDVAVRTDSSTLLAQAPEVDENYFVVPKILDEK